MEEIPVADKRKLEETEVNLIISEENQGLCKVVDIDRFRNLRKLLLCTAMVFRFIDNCRGKKVAGDITVDELEGAHNEWIKQVQEKMKKGKQYHQWAKAMALFQDTQGLVRSRGRFERAELEYVEVPFVVTCRSQT